MKNNNKKHQKQAFKNRGPIHAYATKKTTQKKIKISRLTLPLSSTSHVVHHLHCFIVTLFYTFSTFHAHIHNFFFCQVQYNIISQVFSPGFFPQIFHATTRLPVSASSFSFTQLLRSLLCNCLFFFAIVRKQVYQFYLFCLFFLLILPIFLKKCQQLLVFGLLELGTHKLFND